MLRKATFLGLLLALSLPAQAQVLESDSLALVALYNSTDGANWGKTWDLNTPVVSWHGVTVTGGVVDTVKLHGNNLVGTIPPELGNMTNLTFLFLRGNHLTGSIPAELGNLTNLTQLFFPANQLTGSIPAELGNLASLTLLSLANNQLSGSIPSELGNLANLRRLNLSSNLLTAAIPPELGNLASLTYLWL
ncbi:MAG: Two component regulator three Y domain protein, partial [Candidatus Neomarinimicrobiota bacterium]